MHLLKKQKRKPSKEEMAQGRNLSLISSRIISPPSSLKKITKEKNNKRKYLNN
jgi:hypothetical protein